jgi:hypothetical protein
MTVLGRSEIRHTDAAADLAGGRRSLRRALVVVACGGGHRSLRRAVVAVACAALLAGALGAAPAAAGTAYVDGISDQNLGLWDGDYLDAAGVFSQPFTNFFADSWVGVPGAQHLLYARFVTAPDVVAQGGLCEANLYNWFTYVTQTLHLIPVISVWDVPEGGCANHGAPSATTYTNDIQQLLTYLDGLYPGTTLPYIEAWNEPNSSGVTAAAAAGYWSAANTLCATAGCTAIAGDLVDNDPDQGGQSFNPGCAANLTYSHLATYEDSYVAALGSARPAIWGFHPYFAVNCRQSTSVTTFENNLPTPAGQVWFTEVGAWECVNGQSPARGVAEQQADAQYLVNTLMSATAPGAPAHVFYYGMAAPGYTLSCSKYADSELYEAAVDLGPLSARPAAATIYGADAALAAASAAPSAVTSTQATFNGTITPGGIYEGSYYFEYGTTDAYGSQTATAALGPGLAPAPVSATVEGLTPDTPYHYRLVATDASNDLTVNGADQLMAPVEVSVSPASVIAGQAVTVSWSGVSNPSAGDWVGIFEPGAPASSYLGSFYAGSCAQTDGATATGAGSCTFTVPAIPGTYELRLYASTANDLLSTSGTISVLPPPPVDTLAPVITGASGLARAYAGDLLSCSNGTWANAPTAYGYQWASDGAPVAGASAQTYAVPLSQLGDRLTCSVNASNAGGSGPASVSADVTVVSARPVDSSPPSISGAAVVGMSLRGSRGSWSNGPTSFAYQWQRCDRLGKGCTAIAGATHPSYTLRSADAGSTIRVLVSASNARAVGAPTPSRVTAVVKPPAPNTLLSAETIDSAGARATFRFRAGGDSSGFQCALARVTAGARTPPPAYARCSSPATFTHLQPASYVFDVRAIGPGGTDPTPAGYRFAIR